MLFEIDTSRANGSTASRVRRLLDRAAEILVGLLLLLQLLSIFRGAQAAESFFS